jgi:hypothetical protein
MKLGFKGIVITTLISSAICSMPLARAAHATNFLDALYQEVTNRVANPGTNSTAAQRAALRAASNILGRNTRTFSADLSALATAATVLNTRFESNATFTSLEEDAIADYAAEADAQLDTAELHVGTNAISRVLSNQLAGSRVALSNAVANSNGVPARARALARVFNKMRIPVAKVLRMFPTVPFEAPTEMATGRNLTLYENAIVNEQNIFYFHTTGGEPPVRFLHYSTHNPEELGTWTYERLTPTTAVIHCNVTFTQAGARTPPYSHDIPLTFTSATTGTFTAVNCLNETVQGTFVLSE